MSAPRLTARRFAAGLLVVVALAALLRGLFPTADPPWRTTVGVVWHDEGAWVHNARNRALFGAWRLDAWNPVFVAPVFTALEYASFRTFGVGTWQARLVSQAMGIVSVLLLGLGVARIAGRRAGLVAAAFLATNYVYVMYDRAALMEATMAAFLVMAWYAWTRAAAAAGWGLVAGVAACLAYFTKAAAAFFVAALGLLAVITIVQGWRAARSPGGAARESWSGAWWTLAGLTLGAVAALALFVGPHWREYWFYNWQMSVTRKPSYDLGSIATRVSWLPVLHDTFTRSWFATTVGLFAAAGVALRWARAHAGERLLLLWLVTGIAELILHDVGNERRLVMLIPALAGLAALALGRGTPPWPEDALHITRTRALVALPIVAYAAYLVTGALARLPFFYEVRPSVRLAAALAALATIAFYLWWPRVVRLLAGTAVPAAVAVAIATLVVAGDLAQFGQYAAGRTYKNVEASRLVGQRLPPGTLVHGKLANGLALDNGIRPVFVGKGFGNYADRLERPDVRYVLTYVSPRVGYEGPVILDVLDACPRRRILWEVDVAETTTGRDRAALIEKEPGPR